MKLSRTNALKVTCNGTDIVSQKSVTYLGLTLEQSLTCTSIADKLLSKCAGKLKFLYRKARHLDFSIKKLLVVSLIQCHFDDACSAWYCGVSVNLKNRLQVMQNNVIRYLLNAPTRTHIGRDAFKRVGLLPVHVRVEQLKLNHMFNVINGSAPKYCTHTHRNGSYTA